MVYNFLKKMFQPEGLPQFLTTSKHNATYTRKQIVCKKNFDKSYKMITQTTDKISILLFGWIGVVSY